MTKTILLVIPNTYASWQFEHLTDRSYTINMLERTVEEGEPHDEHEEALFFEVVTAASARSRGITTGEGCYLRNRDGSWQILGYSVQLDGLDEICRAAWDTSISA